MLPFVLRALGVACIIAGLCHVLFGVSGDWIVGINPASPIDPSLDSQNRFYGAAFLLYGALLWIGAADMRRNAVVLRTLLGVMFIAGCARLLAVMATGWPSATITALGASEIILPPLLWIWLTTEFRKRRSGLR